MGVRGVGGWYEGCENDLWSVYVLGMWCVKVVNTICGLSEHTQRYGM